MLKPGMSVRITKDSAYSKAGQEGVLVDFQTKAVATVRWPTGSQQTVLVKRLEAALPDYAALGQTDEEAALLREHDEFEQLHAYDGPAFPDNDGTPPVCLECGDDSSGLMHNNTWRNVEPLLDTE